MNKLFSYFYNSKKLNLLERLKTNALIVSLVIGSLLLIVFIYQRIISGDKDWLLTFYSLIAIWTLIGITFVLLKKNGIRKAGSFFSFFLILILVIRLQIPEPHFLFSSKFIRGFYTLMAGVAVGALFASRLVFIVNVVFSLLGVTRIYILALNESPDMAFMIHTAFIYYLITCVIVFLSLYFMVRFSEMAIDNSEKDALEKDKKNKALILNEEKLKVALQEVILTAEALELTNSKLTVAKRKAEESDHLKTEFLQNISHEIRTPLNGIMGFAKLLNQPDLSQEKRLYYTNFLFSNSNRLLRKIEDIIEISQIVTKQTEIYIERIDIDEVFVNLMHLFSFEASAKNLELRVNNNLSKLENLICSDLSLLTKALTNLLDNAIKFTSLGFVELGAYRADKNLNLYVKDTGIGINKINLEKIFIHFAQEEVALERKPEGLGLGLSIANAYIELLGGSLIVESEKGKGALFTLQFEYNVDCLGNK
jgi:signal transduction histidine kinase